MKTKNIVLGALLAVISSLFQCIPALFSETFIFVTIFSAIPIYLISRIEPVYGILSYIIAFILISLISPHENIMFIFTNGIVGLSLGISQYYLKKRPLICIIAGIFLTLSICIVNFLIGINIIGFSFSFSIIPILIIFMASYIYYFMFLILCNFIYKRLNPMIEKTR